VHKDAGLPPSYNVFGLLTQGFEVLDALAAVAVGGAQRSDPLEPQVIHTIEIGEE
jgi:cyclophilin family peptidyl-prolyl cis-trans isomerase